MATVVALGLPLTAKLQVDGGPPTSVDPKAVAQGCGADGRVSGVTGPRTMVAGWTVVGGDSALGRSTEQRLRRARVVFSGSGIQEATRDVTDAYRRAGYGFAQVEAACVQESGGRVHIALYVRPGTHRRVELVEFAGQQLPDQRLLARLAKFQPAYDAVRSSDAVRGNLNRSGLVRVDSIGVVDSRGRAGLRFWVTALRPNRLAGLLGWSPTAGRLTGAGRLAVENLLGTGRKLGAEWHAGERTRYELRYTEPWVAGSSVAATAVASHVAQDSAYARTSLGFEGRTPVTGSLEVMAGLGYDWSVDSALAAAVGEGWVGTGLVIDTRDFAPAPTRGLRIRGATRAGSRSSSSTQVVSRAELDAVVHLPLNDALGATVRLGGRTVHASVQLSAAELYELGGAGSVRGFREGQFLGRQAVWVTAEPGWRAGTFEVYPFVDAGAYAGSQSRGIVAGYGFGLSASSRAGSAAADFGIAWGESPLRGKIHMGLTAAF